MMRSVYLRILYERRFFIVGWTIGFATLAALMTTFYPAMHQDGTVDALVKNLPAAFKGLVGDLTNLKSFDTYIAAQLFDVRMRLIAGVMAIILGLGLSVAEEERGELRTLLALPISRSKLFFQTWLAMVTILFIASLGLIVGIYAVLPFIEGGAIELFQVLRLVGMTLLVMTTFATIPYAVGRAFGKRSVANGLAILLIIGSFLLSTFGQAVDWLKEYETFSLLHYFPAVEIVTGIIEVSDIAVYAGIIGVLLVVSVIIFRRRDVA